jgi:hypothetical protein
MRLFDVDETCRMGRSTDITSSRSNCHKYIGAKVLANLAVSTQSAHTNSVFVVQNVAMWYRLLPFSHFPIRFSYKILQQLIQCSDDGWN